MTHFRVLIAALLASLATACTEVPTQSAATTSAAAQPTQTNGARTFLFSWGMFADPVFDRDVITFNAAYAARYGAPAQIWAFGANSGRLTRPNSENTSFALANMAQKARDGQDLVVVMLTSHGAPNVIAVQPSRGGQVADVSADQLADLLEPLQNDRQILILQACFSGSLIDELRGPNRIIMAAASADRSSFGCNPDSANTWFIKSLNRAMAQGGSWDQIFARTKRFVAADEAAQGVPASNPQRFIGRNMQDVWAANAN